MGYGTYWFLSDSESSVLVNACHNTTYDWSFSGILFALLINLTF